MEMFHNTSYLKVSQQIEIFWDKWSGHVTSVVFNQPDWGVYSVLPSLGIHPLLPGATD